MKAIQIKNSKGPATSLYIDDHVAAPRIPVIGEALVKVDTFALNRMDILQREGIYPVPEGASSILGVEFCGIVLAVGSPDEHFKVGDKVFGLASGGAYAEQILVQTSLLIKYSPSAKLEFQTCAGIPEVWFTATQALIKIAEIQTTGAKRILIHAGASGVGIAALQIAKKIIGPGGTLFATVGSQEKIDFLSRLISGDGVEFVPINYKTQDFEAVVSQHGGADAIVDFIGPAYLQKNIKCLNLDGRLVLLSLLSGSGSAEVPVGLLLRKRLRIEASTLRSRTIKYQTGIKSLFEQYAYQELITGEFVNPIDKTFQWSEIVRAHEYMESNQSMGKILCTI
ncbi:uncharacterized protein V1516DRAFT_681178, partial [Lipomyces oligophaga]|uniref:uncharacterized protein n=1 Tax=Lipomyces oligophaga TaxID=45792 RepID=UPI0034CF11F0